jgi:hypothetical protein
MALATVNSPAIPEAPMGARARQAALKAAGANGLGLAGGPRVVPLGVAGISPTPMLSAAAPAPGRYGQRSRWRGAAEMVLFLVVLIGALGGGLLLVDSSLRDQAASAYDRMLKVAHLKTDTGSQTPDPQLPGQLPPVNPTGGTSPSANPVAPPLESDTVTKPANVAAPAPLPAPMPAAHTDVPADLHTPPPAVSTSDLPDDGSTAADQARAKELRDAAFAAESRFDWASAISDYRQILKLPKSVQYTDLEVRLHNDQTLLAQSQAPSH